MERLQQHIEHLVHTLRAEFLAHPSWHTSSLSLSSSYTSLGSSAIRIGLRPAGHYSGWHVIEDFLGRRGLRIVSGPLILLAIVLLSYLFLRSSILQ